MKKVHVLFVCLGNICRSPTAEGVFRHLLREEGLDGQIVTDSAGTHAYHVGAPPDPRAQETARSRGIDLSDLRGRKALADDFDKFDYVLAMDEENYHNLARICPPEHREKLHMFLDFAPHLNESEVPDPYYGGAKGFDRVFDMVEEASRGLLADIRQRYLG
ncbi:low molecular weight protein-tyrosine-phosphatase [Thiohalophilus sp.]|uniref:low molecular weight protein-tyrosine-phosphatase n=1 Tax=Thiohalophilus sp. TaxID=3028392 RepID=UPI002ACE8C55|nr:low molecular weight protein-tyrosine-phosphatase [Thiohalophilus sp.]MDZ7805027.1 low molecular weight protein-tyrosine-phosphatase [Thiohalophilus sp.]